MLQQMLSDIRVSTILDTNVVAFVGQADLVIDNVARLQWPDLHLSKPIF